MLRNTLPLSLLIASVNATSRPIAGEKRSDWLEGTDVHTTLGSYIPTHVHDYILHTHVLNIIIPWNNFLFTYFHPIENRLNLLRLVLWCFCPRRRLKNIGELFAGPQNSYTFCLAVRVSTFNEFLSFEEHISPKKYRSA
ncbi:uncharacterized protein LOC108632447 isoform X1 [Ceratina calcarata]|uniref:Uncharacterized protein LOC108632447 isoform X1 n=1 Tax=Ceratina calcarata TaxID=156304 RepID=A0AAJ7WGC3_9HYME|nr:uncharacterized protein LOC108632447 isoform X1 [Ceratina calcarata]